MASKGPRFKLDHETKPRRQKALEAPREPPRPKTHWDHVLEEMVWLSKDFEAERKWKLAQAKKVAIRASKSKLDPASRGEKKVKEEEQRLRKVALNISKEVKKFWVKIEKLVLYKHQLELEEKKKKALDKQLDFLLGQTERYSTMLAENLVDMPPPHKPICPDSATDLSTQDKQSNETDVSESPKTSDRMEADGDYSIESEDELQDDEHTIEEDEARITLEERREELDALQDEMDIPLEELLKRYNTGKVSREGSPLKDEDVAQLTQVGEDQMKCKGKQSVDCDNDPVSSHLTCDDDGLSNGNISVLDGNNDEDDTGQDKSQLKGCKESDKQPVLSEFCDEQEDGDYILAAEEEKDDETTLLEEEELAKVDGVNSLNEIELLQKESEISLDELLARYKRDVNSEDDRDSEPDYLSTSSDDLSEPSEHPDSELTVQVTRTNDAVEHVEVMQVQLPDKHLEEVEPELKSDEAKESEDRIADAAAAARSAQPTGNTFLTTKVRTKFPFLLKHPMREYQHIGLDWLVTMYEKRLNGILADEMGLGKTIMTISLLAHLACEKGIWGPHLIVVPTSVMLNWETEFLKWCPAFKILTYFGSAKERKLKRQGWMKPNSFHVCITTYRLVIQDSKAFKRKKWKYLILDEAHLIKNWKSQRWQTLLNFNSKRRILLTGTPLQNDLMELWSLMHFLMPHIFQSHQEFKDWFSNPISGMVEGQDKINKEVVDRLHNVLRPFILRRLKRDVEKQLPRKYEHVICCRLSKRQRNLYEDFIASSETQATLASSNFFGMISVIMQLRKVCNHPDLFEGRPIISSFDMSGIDMQLSSSICMMPSSGPFSTVDLKALGLLFTHYDFSMFSWETDELEAITTPANLIKESACLRSQEKVEPRPRCNDRSKKAHGTDIFEEIQKALWEERVKQAKDRAASVAWWNSLQCGKKPVYGTNLIDLVTVKHPIFDIHQKKSNPSCFLDFSSKLGEIVLSPVERFNSMLNLVEGFMFAIPAARAPSPVGWCSTAEAPVFLHSAYIKKCTDVLAPLLTPIRPAIVRRQVYFPDRRLIQFDCGKLQELAVLLRRLKSEGHRALIFTQMTKMLDILEAFINLYGYTYMRLDGSTPPEERQTLMQRFNTNPKIFLFILSTRSGGVGINLVGADTVIFYDSDWNPAMDQQAQDRCHRIGQTREVHIYRLISESTIEENILKKANQKRALDDLVIQSGGYNTEFFKKLDPMELFSGHRELPIKNVQKEKSPNDEMEILLSNADVEAALKQAEDEADYMALKKVEEEEAVDNQEFTEEAVSRLEDDEIVNEDDLKFEEKIVADQSGCMAGADKEVGASLDGSHQNEERAVVLAAKEDDIDMLADVKQMAAAAAAAGEASSAFENQLRPIDRYAMRFLNVWDPLIDKSSIESDGDFEETEWELDRIEKFKEDMEAENDDEEEPLLYEQWDADFATEAYRQHVEVLTQRQLMEELEEAKEAELRKAESARIELSTERKPKPKKKIKKTKFKSLKKGALAYEAEAQHEEPATESMSIDDEVEYSDMDELSDWVESYSPVNKKRKKTQKMPEVEEIKMKKKKPKKSKKSASDSSHVVVDSNILYKHNDENFFLDHDHKPAGRSKMGGKISITVMPVKRVLVVRPEKLKNKGNIWSRGSNASPDPWPSQEDALLCAIIHEYGTNWSLVSDMLYGMTAGGSYRGRFRHPAHCCERFRELFQKYVLSATEAPNNEKASNTGSGKAIFKVTEDSTLTLLDVASNLADNDLLLQKHFAAIISSVWRERYRHGFRTSMLLSSPMRYHSSRKFLKFSPYKTSKESVRGSQERFDVTFSGLRRKLIAAALHDIGRNREDALVVPSHQREEGSVEAERMDVMLDFQTEGEDSETPLPSAMKLSIYSSDPLSSDDVSKRGTFLLGSSCKTAENRFRVASRACFDGESAGWASSAFSAGDSCRFRSTPKQQSLGKNKAPMSDSVKSSKVKLQKVAAERNEELQLISRTLFPSPKTVGFMDSIDGQEPFTIQSSAGNDDMSIFSENAWVEENLTAVPHHYDPDFTSGLEDLTLSPELTDIG